MVVTDDVVAGHQNLEFMAACNETMLVLKATKTGDVGCVFRALEDPKS
jgi:hypothetical protein